jgi:predicted metal-binding membrane protein
MTTDSGFAARRTLPRRDLIAVVSALAGTTVLAWIYLIRASGGMMEPSTSMEMVRIQAWDAGDFVMIFLMWVIMMVGMMVPSAAPTTMVYAGVARKAERQGAVVAPTVVFVSGYVTLWAGFSVFATSGQWALDQAALLSPMMVATSPLLGAVLLVAAGVYQVTPIKLACLKHCQSPIHFISEHWRPGIAGAFRMGLRHGTYCVGCCWVLMCLLFLGGVMNLLWIAAIAVFVFGEKVMPTRHAEMASRITGAAMVLVGVALLVKWTVAAG